MDENTIKAQNNEQIDNDKTPVPDEHSSGNIDNRNYEELDRALALAQHDVYKQYLNELSYYPLVAPSEILTSIDIKDRVQLLKLKKFTHTKGEDLLQKLSTVYHSAMALGCTLIVMVDAESNSAPANIYLGVRNNEISESTNNDKEKLETSFHTLCNGLKAQFPGTDFDGEITEEDILTPIFGSHVKHISSVTCVAALRDKQKTEEKKFIQGIEKLIDTMKGTTYTALFIAEPVSSAKQREIREGYQELYSTLAPFAKTSWSFNENNSESIMNTVTTGTAKTITAGTSHTKGHSTNVGISIDGSIGRQDQHGTSNPTNAARVGQALASPGASNLMNIIGGLAAFIPGAGPVISAGIGILGQAMNVAGSAMTGGSISDSIAKSLGASLGLNAGFGTQTSETKQELNSETEQTQDSTSEGSEHSTGRTIQTENINKAIVQLMERIDAHLKRTAECEDFGAYNCCAYFLSAGKDTSLLAANTYRALMLGEGSSIESGAINTWSNDNNEIVRAMLGYLSRFTHPVFALAIKENPTDSEDFVTYTPANIVSGLELPLHLGLPTRSVYGLPVTEHAEFGRNVSVKREIKEKLPLGHIYHMGTKEKAPVDLCVSELPAHTFITGSTGSGKTNTVCTLLNELTKKQTPEQTPIHFLVIEPAKGEYKNKFAGREDVHVYGTNPKLTLLLRINPFRFDSEHIHILEHLDRLVEIFNVCWPMYAAMPAILKESVENAYKEAGWDLITSTNKYEIELFPSFGDVCRHIEQVVAESAYSADNKSDYTGALVTRVKSLTTGLNSLIFSNDDIPDSELFDKNVIIDLSRVGSTETKSLIMGMLVLKLQEYRMSQNFPSTDALRHVTVLEEAHNLLKRTSTEQVSESANLLGKSVEMLANAIAEMRAYGEGFVIADQSPGLLDMSVIRNTNTKIIMRLPDLSDRELVGKAAGLNDDQIVELGKLDQGVAAVMQSGWLESVLCKVSKCDSPNQPYQGGDTEIGSNTVKEVLINALANKKLTHLFDRPDEHVLKANIPVTAKITLINNHTPTREEAKKVACEIAYELFQGYKLNDKANHLLNAEQKKQLVVKSIKDYATTLTPQQIQCIMGYIFSWHHELTQNAEVLSLAKECFGNVQ